MVDSIVVVGLGDLVVGLRVGDLAIGFGAAYVGLLCDYFGWVISLFVLWFKAHEIAVVLMLLIWAVLFCM